jgi:hypothetical protein
VYSGFSQGVRGRYMTKIVYVKRLSILLLT